MKCRQCQKEIPDDSLMGVCQGECLNRAVHFQLPLVKSEPEPESPPKRATYEEAKAAIAATLPPEIRERFLHPPAEVKQPVPELPPMPEPSPIEWNPDIPVEFRNLWLKHFGRPLIGQEKFSAAVFEKDLRGMLAEEGIVLEPEQPIETKPTVEKAPPAKKPTPKKPKQRRGFKRVQNALQLGQRIAHWMLDHGGARKSIPKSTVYRALTLSRYPEWQDAVREMTQRGILQDVKGGLLVAGPDKLMDLEQEQAQAQTRRRTKKRRPPTQWFKDRRADFDKRDGLVTDDEPDDPFITQADSTEPWEEDPWQEVVVRAENCCKGNL